MLNSLRTLSKHSGPTDSDSDDAAALDPLLRDGESIRYVLTSSKGIEQTDDGRTTKVEPDSNHDAYSIVTDHRVLFLVGTDADELSIDIDFDLSTVTMVKARDSLFSSSLVVVSEQTNSVKFTPSGGADLEEVADYIDRVGDAWADLYRALALVREAIDEFEASLTAGEDAREELTTAQSRLSNAHHHATRNEDGPVDSMLALIEPVTAELDALRVDARLDRVGDLLAEAEDRDAFADSVAALVEARDRLDEARDALDDEAVDGDAATETIDEHATAVDEYAASLLADAEDRCHEALAATDAATAASTWETALERYRAALDADWGTLGGADAAALRFQRAWVVGRRIDALCAHSAALEAEGDELDDDGGDATASYEKAKERAEAARALAEEYPVTNADRFDDRLDDLQEKIDISEWQWGDA